jgi:hypothetical protein
MSTSTGDAVAGPTDRGRPADRRLPPVTELATLALALVVVGGIFFASYAPRPAPMAFPIVLACAAGALLVVAGVLMSRLRGFAWHRFWLVARWTLLAYLIEMGMIGYVFVHNDVRGSQLALLFAMLVIFATSVPIIVGFTVARYERSTSPPSAGRAS